MSLTKCRLTYHLSDPYAVTLETTSDNRSWTFARSLLAEGASGHAGVGDVRIWRVRDSAEPLIAMLLGGPRGTLHRYATLSSVTSFVAATERAVALGREQLPDDLDAQLEQLLGDPDADFDA
jgi:hypothetical protein